jgi:hypothetical protein
VIDAESEKSAYGKATSQGVLPIDIIPASDVQSDDAKYPKPLTTHARRKDEDEIFRVVVVVGVFLIFAMVCVLAWQRLPSRPPDDSDIRPDSHFSSAEPSTGTFRYPTGDQVVRSSDPVLTTTGTTLHGKAVGAINETAYDRMIKLNIAGDRTGFAALMDEGLVFLLDSGTRVRIIDRGILKTEIKVESGPYSGRYLIVDAASVDR